jgi:hypothetical protein
MSRSQRDPKGVVGVLALLAGSAAGVWWFLRRRRAPTPLPLERPSAPSAAALLQAIVGNDKQAIAAIFGPPRASAGFAALAPALLVRSDYLLADTWYYALDKSAQLALVVRFDSGVASHAELVQIPSI